MARIACHSPLRVRTLILLLEKRMVGLGLRFFHALPPAGGLGDLVENLFKFRDVRSRRGNESCNVRCSKKWKMGWVLIFEKNSKIKQTWNSPSSLEFSWKRSEHNRKIIMEEREITFTSLHT